MSGRSAARNIQGIVAETGPKQAAIIDELMFNVKTQLRTELNNQFIIDQVALDFSEESAKAGDRLHVTRFNCNHFNRAIQASCKYCCYT